jgi:hypothetical protein
VGQSRHFDSAPRTSALPRSADIADQVREVRKVPTAEVGACIVARRHAWSFRHPGYPVRVLISLNVLRSPSQTQPVHNSRSRDALGGVDLSRDRPSLSGFFNPSRHRMPSRCDVPLHNQGSVAQQFSPTRNHPRIDQPRNAQLPFHSGP